MSAERRRSKRRANGEGSIFPYRNGYAAYVWVTTPSGEKRKKWVYGKTRDEVHSKYVDLLAKASKGPVPTKVPTVERYLTYWLEEVIRPNREPATYDIYETMSRLYVIPGLGKKRLDRLNVRDTQKWLNRLAVVCRCCAQGKDARRVRDHKSPRKRQRCCAIGACCRDYPSRRTIAAARDTLRAALGHAMTEEIVGRNVAFLVKLPTVRRRSRKASSWSVEDARRFLESVRTHDDPLYAAWVLVLTLGLRRGEVLGLRWDDVDWEAAELSICWQLQRVRGQLIHKERTKTDDSTDSLPLPAICVTALQVRKAQQAEDRRCSGMRWRESGLVFTTRHGTPIEPRNANRAFHAACARAGVPAIRVHDTRHVCGSLLAALDVHPRVAMRILRHSKIAITMEVYTQVPSEDTRKALRRLGDHLGAVVSDPASS
jgi:integrase